MISSVKLLGHKHTLHKYANAELTKIQAHISVKVHVCSFSGCKPQYSKGALGLPSNISNIITNSRDKHTNFN